MVQNSGLSSLLKQNLSEASKQGIKIRKVDNPLGSKEWCDLYLCTWKSIGIIYLPALSLLLIKWRGQKILSWQHRGLRRVVWPWPLNVWPVNRDHLLIKGNPCNKFGIDQVKGSKDIEWTTLGLHTDRHTNRPTVAKQLPPFSRTRHSHLWKLHFFDIKKVINQTLCALYKIEMFQLGTKNTFFELSFAISHYEGLLTLNQLLLTQSGPLKIIALENSIALHTVWLNATKQQQPNTFIQIFSFWAI